MARSASGFPYGLDCPTHDGYHHRLVYYDPGYVLIPFPILLLPCPWGIFCPSSLEFILVTLYALYLLYQVLAPYELSTLHPHDQMQTPPEWYLDGWIYTATLDY